jgi:uncharacterized membrane protein YjgN (DUF898 family)
MRKRLTGTRLLIGCLVWCAAFAVLDLAMRQWFALGGQIVCLIFIGWVLRREVRYQREMRRREQEWQRMPAGLDEWHRRNPEEP